MRLQTRCTGLENIRKQCKMAPFPWFDLSNVIPSAVRQILVRAAHESLNTFGSAGWDCIAILIVSTIICLFTCSWQDKFANKPHPVCWSSADLKWYFIPAKLKNESTSASLIASRFFFSLEHRLSRARKHIDRKLASMKWCFIPSKIIAIPFLL